MTHVYKVTGMTCMSCEQKVHNALMSVDGVEKVEVSKDTGRAVISMSRHLPVAELGAQIKRVGNYSIQEEEGMSQAGHSENAEPPAPASLRTYTPLIMIFVYLLGAVVIRQLSSPHSWMWMDAMSDFMGGFFVVFSFFKLINLNSFADAYSTYDVIAKRWRGYGFIYPFIELALGLAYLLGWELFTVNIITLLVMSISTIGVVQALVKKRAIQCACLGTVFNLPMTYVTVIEDLLMVLMSAIMLFI